MLEVVGLHRPELRAWAMYDWANSAFMATVVATVFPIYFVTVAGADLEPEGGELPLRHDDVHRPLDHGGAVPGARRGRRLRRCEEEDAGGLSGPRCGRDRLSVLRPPWGLAPGRHPVHRGEHRGDGQLRVLRLVPAPHRQSRRDGPGLDRRLRARVSGRWAVAGREHGVDPVSGVVRYGRSGARGTARMPSGRRSSGSPRRCGTCEATSTRS